MKIAHKKEKPQFNGEHEFGIFWEFDKKGDAKIDRETLYYVANCLGFRLYNGDAVRIDGMFISLKTDVQFFDEIKSYINLQQPFELNKVCSAYEAFIQRAGKFTISRLRELDLSIILKDTETTSYKFYSNLFIEITKEGIIKHNYIEVNGKLIWKHNIIEREWKDVAPDKFKYLEFLHLAIGINPQLMKIIGYLCHEYKGENTGYIITLTEQSPDPRGGGGSGKNVFANLLKLNTSVHSVGGSVIQTNEKFLQSWHYERVMILSDIPKRFDFLFLKEISTGVGTLKRLYKDEISIAPENMPKLMALTNYSFDAIDGGLKRRIIPTEFTDFFTKCGGVDAHFGCMFPQGWSEDDYIGYDHFITLCIKTYLMTDGKLTATELSDGGWEKQFSQKFGELTYNFIVANMDDWLLEKEVSVNRFNKMYEDFIRDNNVQKKFELSAIMMNRAIEEYCDRNNINYLKSHVFKDHADNTFKGKFFERKEAKIE